MINPKGAPDAPLNARADLAAAFRWAARLDMHEAVANHFSLAVNETGTRFLINPAGRHFARIRASDLLEIDASDSATAQRSDALDPTAWGLHGALHRLCPHVRCAVHAHPTYATVLSCLDDPLLPPIDQTACSFYGRQAVDLQYGGLAFEDEGARCAELLADPAVKVLTMGNHGILCVGATVAEAFNTLYYFERAARSYILALQTGRPIRMLSDTVARKTAGELARYTNPGRAHFGELRAILDAEGSDYAT